MLLGILAAASVVAAPTVDPTVAPQPPDWKPPAWYKKPSAEEIHAAWPVKALNSGIAGNAKVNCRVNIHGLAEDCQVVSEEPAGDDFGAAALLLTPDLLFKPATVAAGPVPSRVVIPIKFDWPAGRPGGGVLGDTFTLISHPLWTQAPSFADLGAAYPKGGVGAAGYVAFRCAVRKSGELKDCDLLREEPAGKGFASAARSLLPKFHVETDSDTLAMKKALQVNLPIRLIDPAGAEFASRHVGEPVWTTGISPTRILALFPAEAVARGLKTGQGIADCAVSADGALTDCSPLAANPDGVGFSEAAVLVAQVMKMNPWTQDGGPVDGARVKLPIRFNLAQEKTPPAAP